MPLEKGTPVLSIATVHIRDKNEIDDDFYSDDTYCFCKPCIDQGVGSDTKTVNV